MAVWEDHLLPLLTCKDAARLGRTCKVLRVVVREHFKDIGMIEITELKAALTTFPRGRTVEVTDSSEMRQGGFQGAALVQWLCEGGRGRYLESVRAWGEVASDVEYRSLREGALPSLKSVDVDLDGATALASLTRGLLGGMHELRVMIDCTGGDHQIAVLGLVGQLPALAKLEISIFRIGFDDFRERAPVEWPPFIPPTLKSLRVDVSGTFGTRHSFLGALPGVIGASGAKLERLEVKVPGGPGGVGDWFSHMASALRVCSPTLKVFLLLTPKRASCTDGLGQRERLRVQWADVLAGVSACRELQVLVLPRTGFEPLFPPSTVFDRLTHLEVSDYERERRPSTGVEGLWELMASGGLPALAKLSMRLDGEWGSVRAVRTRVAPALEAVAGTLTHLCLKNYTEDDVRDCRCDDVDVGYELGVALGKLRRLKDLALGLFRDGDAYHAVAQGLAASGGDRPLPLLWRVRVLSTVRHDADLLASLLLPKVRVFGLGGLRSRQAALLVACAVHQAGYKHTLVLDRKMVEKFEGTIIRAIASCIIGEDSSYHKPTVWCVHRL
jgi:hypothetical protein